MVEKCVHRSEQMLSTQNRFIFVCTDYKRPFHSALYITIYIRIDSPETCTGIINVKPITLMQLLSNLNYVSFGGTLT